MCLGMATTLGASSSQSVFVFTLVFMLVWLGSLAVTANARLLGYRMYHYNNFSTKSLKRVDLSSKMYA